MSQFNKKVAAQIAQRAARSSGNRRAIVYRPLAGKQLELLEALKDAELAHDNAVHQSGEERQQYELFKERVRQHRSFSKQFNPMMRSWRHMTQDAKEQLVWVAHGHWAPIKEWMPKAAIGPTLDTVDAILSALEKSTNERIKFVTGRKPGRSQTGNIVSLQPLWAFAEKLKVFWERLGEEWTVEFEESTPKSAAANFVVEAAKHLKIKYDPASIDSVMEDLRDGIQFAHEFSFEMELDDQLNDF
jgi:hypothetical protein